MSEFPNPSTCTSVWKWRYSFNLVFACLQSHCFQAFDNVLMSASAQPRSHSTPSSSPRNSARESFCLRLLGLPLGISIVRGIGEDVAESLRGPVICCKPKLRVGNKRSFFKRHKALKCKEGICQRRTRSVVPEI